MISGRSPTKNDMSGLLSSRAVSRELRAMVTKAEFKTPGCSKHGNCVKNKPTELTSQRTGDPAAVYPVAVGVAEMRGAVCTA